MSSKWSLIVLACALAMVLVALVVEPAMAEPAASNGGIAEGTGKMLQTWAKWLIPGVVAVVGIPAIARHDFGMAISIFIVALLLGMFAFISVDQFKSIVLPIINSITGA